MTNNEIVASHFNATAASEMAEGHQEKKYCGFSLQLLVQKRKRLNNQEKYWVNFFMKQSLNFQELM